MDRSSRAGIILLAGIALLGAALAIHTILLETVAWSVLLAVAGIALSAWGAYSLRSDLGAMLRRRRGEIALHTLGVIGVLIALAYLSVLYPLRFDLTRAKRYSLSEQTVVMLTRLDKPVHIVFFHDPMMRETLELYQLIARQNKLITVEFYDPMLHPAQARLLGVQFAGTAVMQSADRKLQVQSGTEVDIANGILRISQGATQLVCFLDGHGEPDPFSLESHDHLEGAPGHSHGIGAKLVVHERHGMAKARNALEAMNYKVEKVSLVQSGDALSRCAVLIVPGPKTALLPAEVAAVRDYLLKGGNAFFMLDPFVKTGLETLLLEYGIVLDDDIVIDEASHFWADPSSPAVTDYNRHQITQELPLSFYPGARSLSPTPQRVPGTAVIPLVNSSKRSFGETNPTRAELDDDDLPGPRTIMVVANRRPPTPGDLVVGGSKGVTLTVVQAPSRIAVVGDSDFATNSFFHILGNGKVFLNTVNYLAAQENLIGVQPRTYDPPRVNLTNRQMKGTFFLSIIFLPALLAVIGTAVWWRQR